jgi:integrase
MQWVSISSHSAQGPQLDQAADGFGARSLVRLKARKFPAISFHGLRHSHVSALIAGGVDVLTVSRRIGHASPVVTMKVYAHLFSETDKTAAKAIEAALRTGKER